MRKIKKYSFFLISLLVISVTTLFAHAFYLSLTDIAYSQQDKTLNISIKVFSDDLITALETANNMDLSQNPNLQTQNADSLVFQYLQDHLKFKINGKSAPLHYVGKEVEIQATWCYLQVKDVTDFSEVTIFNNIFTELFDTQKNVVKIEKGNQIRSMIFNKSKVEGSVNF